MNEYITKADAIKAMETDCDNNHLTGQKKITVYSAISRIKEINPVADVVQVVRCKDCCHCMVNESHPDKPLICTMTLMCGTTAPDNFCWQGEPEAEHELTKPAEPSLKDRWKLGVRGDDGSVLLLDTYGIAVLDKKAVEKLVESVDNHG